VESAASGGSGAQTDPAGPRCPSAASAGAAGDEIPLPRGRPTPEELRRMAEALAEITHHAAPAALAAPAAAT
jgi:hypothetical protein